MMQLAISTVDRQPNYIGDSLASLARSGAQVDLRIVVCGADAAFLGAPWIERHAARIELLSSEEFIWQKKWQPPHRQIVLTLVRALTGDGDVVLCQDDVEFAPDWQSQLRAAVQQLSARTADGRFLLTLFSTRPPSATTGPVLYDARLFFGMVAMFVPACVRADLRDYVRAEDRDAPDDMLVKRFCLSGGAVLYDLQPSVVQHIGLVSSLGGSSPIRSPSFRGQAT